MRTITGTTQATVTVTAEVDDNATDEQVKAALAEAAPKFPDIKAGENYDPEDFEIQDDEYSEPHTFHVTVSRPNEITYQVQALSADEAHRMIDMGEEDFLDEAEIFSERLPGQITGVEPVDTTRQAAPAS